LGEDYIVAATLDGLKCNDQLRVHRNPKLFPGFLLHDITGCCFKIDPFYTSDVRTTVAEIKGKSINRARRGSEWPPFLKGFERRFRPGLPSTVCRTIFYPVCRIIFDPLVLERDAGQLANDA